MFARADFRTVCRVFQRAIFACVFVMFVGIRAAWAVDYPLTIVTSNSTTTFSFSLTAVGTFYVDCGDGGTLSGTVGTITPAENKIERSSVSKGVYTCSWSGSGAKTVRLGGSASSYSTNSQSSPISFQSYNQVASISGDLSEIFPNRGTGSGQYPYFYRMFYGCSNLTSISANLFAGYTRGGQYLFRETFYKLHWFKINTVRFVFKHTERGCVYVYQYV